MKISAKVSGQGPTLILLHGYAGSVLHWKPIVEQLESRFQVVVVNYGHLYLNRNALCYSEQVAVLGKWILERFPNEKVHLAGISFGGALVWGLGLQFPALIDKTIFINPMPPSPSKHFQMKRMRFFFKIPVSRQAVYLFISTSFGQKFLKKCAEVFRLQSERASERLLGLEGKKRVFIAHLFNNFAWILKQENWTIWTKRLSLWQHSSLMIYDPVDPLFHRTAYSDLAVLLRCERTIQIPGAGHIAIHGAPEKISEAIAEFILLEKSKVA